jgi:hypothetical protein
MKTRKTCLICDGTGLVCRICGESEVACQCDPDDEEYGFEDCPNCTE